MMPQPAAFGLYPSTKALHFGAEALRAARFRQTDISVMYSDGSQAMRLREAESPAEADVADGEPETLGGLLSALSGIGALSMRNDGPYMAAGPILATLIGGCQELLASLRGLGIPDTTVQCFEDKLKQGGLLLSVQCEDEEWAERAQQILHQTGAEHVSATM
ncbi:MAG TPA: hypothetical protein VNJ02_01225 [Vicinamibacterales bacterium]|nr:hypothetical protein [Vicinamibacterales bacterium]